MAGRADCVWICSISLRAAPQMRDDPFMAPGFISALLAAVLLVTAIRTSADPAPGNRPPVAVRTEHEFVIPRVALLRDDGKTALLTEEIDDGRAVVLNFIFTSCAAICPLSSQILAQVQRELGPDRARVHLMSISIDPENDTPSRLREYARHYGAGAGWQHYTSTVAASIATQRAFGLYQRDKMEHTPVTLLRRAPGEKWVQFEGFPSPGELVNELRLSP